MAKGALTWWTASAPGCLTRSNSLSHRERVLSQGEGPSWLWEKPLTLALFPREREWNKGENVMRTPYLVFLGCWLVLGTFVGGLAEATPPRALLMDLTTPAKQRAALLQLRDLADPALKGVLQALKEDALYLWKGETLLILNDAGTLVDLDDKPLLDSAGQPFLPTEGLEQVALEQENMSLVQRALEALELSAPDPAKRRSIALRWGNLQDLTVISLLEKAQAKETVPGIKAVMVETMHKLRLLDPAPQVRQQAIAFFGATRAESALSRLRDLRAKEQDPQVQAAITTAVQRIESYLQMRNAVAYIFNGLSLASILLIMSLGLAITFGLMGIINMAHGEMLMLGSYTAYVLQEFFATRFSAYADTYFLVALPLSLLVVGAVGILLERGLLRFLYGRPLESLLVTWGIGLVLQQSARLYFGDQTSVNPPTWLRGGWEIMPGLIFPYSRIFIIVLSLVCLVVIYWLLYRSNTGLKLRAVMQNRDMAACMGISSRKVDTLTFALGTALAGLAGCALSLIGTVDPEVGKTYIVDSFMVVVLGGVGKLLGTVLASLGVGMSNKLLEPAIGGTAAAVYAKVGILGLVILFLQLKPTGLFPAKERLAAGTVR
jgi:urea transport system permease protein